MRRKMTAIILALTLVLALSLETVMATTIKEGTVTRIVDEVIEIEGDLFADNFTIGDILNHVTVTSDNKDIRWEVNTGESYYSDGYSKMDKACYFSEYMKNHTYTLHLVINPENDHGYVGEGCISEDSIKSCKIMYKGVDLTEVATVKIVPGEAQTSLYLDFKFRYARIDDGEGTGYYYDGEYVRIDSAYKSNYKFDYWSPVNDNFNVEIGDCYSQGTYFVNKENYGEDVWLRANYVKVPSKGAIYSVTAGKRKMTVKMTTAPKSKKADSYQIAYKRKGTKTWKYVTTTSQKKTISKLKKGKKYYVKVRTCKKGEHAKAYSAWSKTKLSKKIK